MGFQNGGRGGANKQLSDPHRANGCCHHDVVGAAADQLLLSGMVFGSRNDFDFFGQISRRDTDESVGGIVGQQRCQSASVVDSGRHQDVFVRGVADHGQHSRLLSLLDPGRVFIDHHKRLAKFLKFFGHADSHASKSTDDRVCAKTGNALAHFSIP